MFEAIIYEGIKVIEGFIVCSFYVHECDCKTDLGIGKLGIDSLLILTGVRSKKDLSPLGLVHASPPRLRYAE
jgi:hypothetical protein